MTAYRLEVLIGFASASGHSASCRSRGGPAKSRAFVTLHVVKVLPPLGQALDMRDSRPAEKLDRTTCLLGLRHPTDGIDRAAGQGSQNALGHATGSNLCSA